MDNSELINENGDSSDEKQDANGENVSKENGQSESGDVNGSVLPMCAYSPSSEDDHSVDARDNGVDGHTAESEDRQTENQVEDSMGILPANTDEQTDSQNVIDTENVRSEEDDADTGTDSLVPSDLAEGKNGHVSAENAVREVEGRHSDEDEIEDDNMLSLSSHDVINNNTPRAEVDTDDIGFVDKSSKSNIDSIDGYVGMDAFPGGNQSNELLSRQIDGREDDEDSSEEDMEKLLAEEGGSTDNSQLAQLIVEHVIGSVVSSFNIDEASSATEKDIEEAMLQQSPRSPVIGQRLCEDGDVLEDAVYTEGIKREEEDVGNVSIGDKSQEEDYQEEEYLREDHEEPHAGRSRNSEEKHQVVEDGDGRLEDDTDKVDIACNKSETDHVSEVIPNLPEVETTGKETELAKELMSGAGDSQEENQEKNQEHKLVRREESIDMSDTECGSMGRLPKLDPLPAYPEFPQNYGNYKVCRPLAPGVKECIILETGECIICKKTTDSGKTVITCTHKHSVMGEEEVVDMSTLLREPVISDQQNSHTEGQTVAEILQSMNLEIIDVKASEMRQPPEEPPDSSIISDRKELSPPQSSQTEQTSVAYMTVDKSQSPQNKRSATQVPCERSYFTEQDLVSGRSVQEEPSMTDRERREEMLREQIILEKVRRDMAEKERAMRERQENQERRERESSSAVWYMGDISSINYSQDVTKDTLSQLPSQAMSDSIVTDRYISQPAKSGDGRHVSEAERRARVERINKYLWENQETGGEMYARLPEQQNHRHEEKSPSRVESDLQRDKAILTELYAKYNIPPPQCNLSASLGEPVPLPQDHSSSLLEGSSRLSSDLEAPPPKSGTVPPFKTLHEQQVGWMRMFHTLEEQHQYELQSQYRMHQESIFKLQQQMEDQLFSQQQSLKKKLAAHKEVLGSPLNQSGSQVGEFDGELDSTSQMIGSYPGEVLETPESIRKTRRQRRSPTQKRLSRSPPWREIYREIRGRGVDSDETESEDVRTHSSGTITDQSQSSLPRAGVYSSPMPLLRKATKSSSSPHEVHRGGSPLRIREMSSPGEEIGTPPKSWHSPRLAQREESPVREEMRTPPHSWHPERVRSPQSEGKRTPVQTRTPPKQGGVEMSPPRSGAIKNHQEISLGGSYTENPSRHVNRREGCQTPTQIERIKEMSHDSISNMELSPRSSLREKHAKHLADLREYYERELQELRAALTVSGETTLCDSGAALSAENQSLILENQELTRQNKDVIRLNQEVSRHNKELEEQLEVANRKIQELSQRIHGLEKRALVYADNYKEAQDKICTFRNKVEELQYTEHQQKDVIEQLQHQTQTQTETIKHLKKVQDEQMHVIQQDRNAYYKLADKHETLERDVSILKDTLNSTENNLYDAREEILDLNRTISKLELENKRLGRENDNIRYRATQHLHKSSSPLGNTLDVPESKSEYIQQSSKEFTPKKSQGRPMKQELSPPCRDDTQRRPPSPEPSLSAKTRASPRISKPYKDSKESEDTDDTSPVMRAERELLRLQQVMRQTDNIDSTPKAPKLQKKKYYGSDISASQNSRHAPLSSPKVRRQKSPTSSPSSRTSYRQAKVPDKKDKSKDLLQSLEPRSSQYKNGAALDTRIMERSGKGDKSIVVNGDTSSRRSLPVHSKNSSQSEGSSERGQTRKTKRSEKTQTESSENNVEDTIERVQSGEIIARPGWENVHTSLVKASSTSAKNNVKPQTAKQRMENIQDLEQRYDNLQTEKNKLEASLSRVPLHGKGRKEKEDLENQLDVVEKELGSVRMSLKRYHVLKSSI